MVSREDLKEWSSKNLTTVAEARSGLQHVEKLLKTPQPPVIVSGFLAAYDGGKWEEKKLNQASRYSPVKSSLIVDFRGGPVWHLKNYWI